MQAQTAQMSLRRFAIVGPGIAFGAFLAALAARGFPSGWELWLWTMAGPFAEPMAFVEYSVPRMTAWGVPLLAAMAAHPCRPNRATGCLSGAAVGLWFLLGFAYTYAGV